MSRPTLKRTLKPGVRYIVRIGTRCRTLNTGDQIWIYGDGSLMCAQAGGWIGAKEWHRFRCAVKIDSDWYANRIANAEMDTAEWRRILEESYRTPESPGEEEKC